MKIIDLLNKMAKGEEVPKRIKYDNLIFTYNKERNCYINNNEKWQTLGDYTALDIWIDKEIEVEDKEYEDIEEITLDDWAEITYSSNWELLTHDFNLNSNTYTNKINALIRNQQKIIEILRGEK